MQPRAEFAYNSMVNRSTGKSLFEIVYGCILLHYLDLAKMHESPLSSSKGEDFAITMTKFMKK